MPLPELEAYHSEQANLASEIYENSRTAATDAADWRESMMEARALIETALISTEYLSAIAPALANGSGITVALRGMLAPPMSQDQFHNWAKPWTKTHENENKQLRPNQAAAVVSAFAQRRDRALTSWIDQGRPPTAQEVHDLTLAVSSVIASQRLATARRNRLARVQEETVVNLLVAHGWIRVSTGLITSPGVLTHRQFAHKARFATRTKPQEVDIACGLKDTVVLAMECKVTNDKTNSIKRVNDVVKKANAWNSHWGSFVKTAALLQGVLKPSDVFRLLEANVEVFWSHDLPRFEDWLSRNA